MKTYIFDAVVDFVLPKKAQTYDATFVIKKEKVPGSFSFYETETSDVKESLIAVSLSQPKTVKWGYSFDVLSPKSEKALGSGKILYPADQKPTGKEAKKRASLFPQLRGEKIEMLAVLTREKGIMGLREKRSWNLHLSQGKHCFLSARSWKLRARSGFSLFLRCFCYLR